MSEEIKTNEAEAIFSLQLELGSEFEIRDDEEAQNLNSKIHIEGFTPLEILGLIPIVREMLNDLESQTLDSMRK
jgi:hypothetical protein